MSIEAQHSFEAFATTVNELDPRLMKTGNRCFHIGVGGGCGLRCAAFCDGECEEPYEFNKDDVNEEFDGEELKLILDYYPLFRQATKEES